MIRVNAEIIRNLGACESGYNNFVNEYPEFDGSFEAVLNLPNVPYADKIWLAKRVLDKNQLIHFAMLSIESVLNIYTSEFPEDRRISDCLSYMNTVEDFNSITDDQCEKLSILRSDVREAHDEAFAANSYSATYVISAIETAIYAIVQPSEGYICEAALNVATYTEIAASYGKRSNLITKAEARIAQANLNLEFLKIVAKL